MWAAKPEAASKAIQGTAARSGVVQTKAVGTAEKTSSRKFSVKTMLFGDSVSDIAFTQILLMA